MKDIKLYDVLVCEDVRNEVGGQHTIIGLVSELNVHLKKDHKGSVIIPLSFMFRLTNLKENMKLDGFHIRIFDSKNNKIEKTILLNQNEINKHFNIVLKKVLINLKETTELSFEIQAKDKNGKSHIIDKNYKFTIHLLKK
ncbi:MAG: hypothetical protein KAH33_03820 [Candidatus Delongbacteria bacterium]|nr:hypothetical protein [Candidatus Delongbacteria bacterium]